MEWRDDTSASTQIALCLNGMPTPCHTGPNDWLIEYDCIMRVHMMSMYKGIVQLAQARLVVAHTCTTCGVRVHSASRADCDTRESLSPSDGRVGYRPAYRRI